MILLQWRQQHRHGHSEPYARREIIYPNDRVAGRQTCCADVHVLWCWCAWLEHSFETFYKSAWDDVWPFQEPRHDYSFSTLQLRSPWSKGNGKTTQSNKEKTRQSKIEKFPLSLSTPAPCIDTPSGWWGGIVAPINGVEVEAWVGGVQRLHPHLQGLPEDHHSSTWRAECTMPQRRCAVAVWDRLARCKYTQWEFCPGNRCRLFGGNVHACSCGSFFPWKMA